MEAAQARLSLHLSKYHIVGNHMSQLILIYQIISDEAESMDESPDPALSESEDPELLPEASSEDSFCTSMCRECFLL